jgi:hypothetical protein
MKKGLTTSEFSLGALSGGGTFELARRTISQDMSLGAGIAVACACLGLCAVACYYVYSRGVAKEGRN